MALADLTFVAPLFVPGNVPHRFEKALHSGADAIIIDLEDAVAFSDKQRARDAVAQYFRDTPRHALDAQPPARGVRLNAAGTEEFTLDIDCLREVHGEVDFLVLPMVHGPADLDALRDALSFAAPSLQEAVVALVESSAGVLNSSAIADHRCVQRLAFGSADLSSELGIEPTPMEEEFLLARSQLVLASAAAGLAGPLDGPHLNVRDTDGLRARTRAARDLGMKGKLSIHPAQVPHVIDALAPSQEQYDQARLIVESFEASETRGMSSIRLDDGTFIDYPIAERARRIVRAYEHVHPCRSEPNSA
ncbi:citrate lyase subunit beta / citryl-CoA lyase [Micrococcus luteus]|uniref:Citrate lyase subunit beta / citryl-CoA lyase n=1 Tax=Micrococcus luteus TaxID=1270 RepID=A0ABD7MAQ4_MICLU|nr:CoA ester lyase [Micrococcus luteus]MCV7563637.1 CoA ester lyase [Micrococcus luteus]MCV7636614.1 CoA ester lyase [Micrococcus luteus]MCV7683534.1 CoA ester lyase [Micrococcus luteus]MDK7177922.1 CoA ester lyase [Micrococcus luteus]SHL88443.1 citrate lyase subunit beta / citryl-CoA lyase [Micrococcus luteus]